MQEKLEEVLKLSEEATLLYVTYITEYSEDWPLKEMEQAKETLGMLTLFCHQINEFIKTTKDKEIENSNTEKFILSYVPKIEVSCHHIINKLSPFIKIS